jgi:L-ascorbate metabolism protein UlaG (beta-lactamase superfamily)
MPYQKEIGTHRPFVALDYSVKKTKKASVTRALGFPMKVFATILLSFYVLISSWQPSRVRAQVTSVPASEPETVVLKWLGIAGWEIRIGQTIILIDPFLTRGEVNRGAEWTTDEAAVLKTINRADYIFAGHSHADHIADIPFIAKKFGSKVIGSRTTTNIALTAGVDKSQLLTISGGEKLDFKDFSVQVIESAHGGVRWSGRILRSKFEEITNPWSGPVRGADFVEGGCYLYYFTLGKHRVLHQSTAGFIEDKLTGLRPDVVLLAATHRLYDLGSVLKILEPKTVMLHHFDEWRAPISEGMPEGNRKRAQRFADDIRAVNPEIKTVIPDFFSLFTLE